MVFHLFHQTEDFFSVDFFVCGAGEGGWLFFFFLWGQVSMFVFTKKFNKRMNWTLILCSFLRFQ